MTEKLDPLGPETIRNKVKELPESQGEEPPLAGQMWVGEEGRARFTLRKIVDIRREGDYSQNVEIKRVVLLHLGVTAEPKADKDSIIKAFTEALGEPNQTRKILLMDFLTWDVLPFI